MQLKMDRRKGTLVSILTKNEHNTLSQVKAENIKVGCCGARQPSSLEAAEQEEVA